MGFLRLVFRYKLSDALPKKCVVDFVVEKRQNKCRSRNPIVVARLFLNGVDKGRAVDVLAVKRIRSTARPRVVPDGRTRRERPTKTSSKSSGPASSMVSLLIPTSAFASTWSPPAMRPDGH